MVITCNGETYIIPKRFEEEVRKDEQAKTIEEFARRLKLKFVELPLDDLIVLDILKDINRVAEQMKEQKK